MLNILCNKWSVRLVTLLFLSHTYKNTRADGSRLSIGECSCVEERWYYSAFSVSVGDKQEWPNTTEKEEE